MNELNNKEINEDADIRELDEIEINDGQQLLNELFQIKEDVAYLRDLFVRRLNEDKQKNILIQKLSEGATYSFIEPFLYDIILLLDRLEKKEDDFVTSVREELYEIINRRGVEIITVTEEFNPSLYKAVKVIDSNEVEKLTVCGLIRNGYIFLGKVIRPAEVIVAKPSMEIG